MLDRYRSPSRPARRRRARARPERRRRARGVQAPTVGDVGKVLASISPGPVRTRPLSRDLADELDADRCGTFTTWHVDGYADPIEVLHYPATWHDDPDPERARWLQPARGGIDAGAGVQRTDADSPREALARFLTGRMW